MCSSDYRLYVRATYLFNVLNSQSVTLYRRRENKELLLLLLLLFYIYTVIFGLRMIIGAMSIRPRPMCP
jgi:sugar phosphate permease